MEWLNAVVMTAVTAVVTAAVTILVERTFIRPDKHARQRKAVQKDLAKMVRAGVVEQIRIHSDNGLKIHGGERVPPLARAGKYTVWVICTDGYKWMDAHECDLLAGWQYKYNQKMQYDVGGQKPYAKSEPFRCYVAEVG